MASNYFLIPDDLANHTIPSLSELRSQWKNIPLVGYRELICFEEQYYSFLNFLHSNIRYGAGWDEETNKFTYINQIYGPPKAGMLFQEVLSTAKILETSLFCHGLQRQIIKEKEELTLGKILTRWKDKPQPDLSPELELAANEIVSIRNKLHPDKLHKEANTFYDRLITDENKLIKDRTILINILKNLQSL